MVKPLESLHQLHAMTVLGANLWMIAIAATIMVRMSASFGSGESQNERSERMPTDGALASRVVMGPGAQPPSSHRTSEARE